MDKLHSDCKLKTFTHLPNVFRLYKKLTSQGSILQSLTFQLSPFYKAITNKDHSYQARFLMHQDSKILLNYPP
jgi:hypothetical protein